MFVRITAALFAAALTSACASAEDASRWAAEEATLGEATQAIERPAREILEEVPPRRAASPARQATPDAELDSELGGDRADRGERHPEGIEEETCSQDDPVWYEYCPSW